MYRLVAVFLLIIFYGVYFAKMLIQKKKGIVTDQMGKSRSRDKVFYIEATLKIMTILMPFAQLAAIIYGRSALAIMGKIFGIYLLIIADTVFILSVICMKDSWRAGIAEDDERSLITTGIYRYSRNPAFLGFDLTYLGVLLMYFNPVLLILSIVNIVIFHLQILQEEKYLTGKFGNEYEAYKSNTGRYAGYGKLTLTKCIMYFYFLLAVWSVLYFATAFIYGGGLSLSWVWIWILIGIFAYIRFKMLKDRVDGKEKINIPTAVKVIYRIVFIAGLTLFMAVEAKIITAMKAEPANNLEYVLVLGARVHGTTPSNPLRVRIEKAAEYASENKSTIIIASGGKGSNEDISEAECIRRELTEKYGVDNDRILLEDMSTDTEENLKNCLEIIGSADASVGIITNGFHEFRAMAIAKNTGYTNVYSVPSITLMPVGIHYVVREFFGMMEYYMGIK